MNLKSRQHPLHNTCWCARSRHGTYVSFVKAEMACAEPASNGLDPRSMELRLSRADRLLGSVPVSPTAFRLMPLREGQVQAHVAASSDGGVKKGAAVYD